MKDSIQEVKNKIDIAEYVGRYCELKRAGRNLKANCPFHHEKTPSFMVSPDRQSWRCFGACQDGGDVISFVMKLENITFFEALTELAQEAGVELKNLNFEDKAWKEKEILLTINNMAAKYYNYLLTTHKGSDKARAYLADRDISPALMETFQLGYAPHTWDSLTSFLHKKGFNDADIEKTGLILKGKTGKYYDRFRGRIMFPIFDSRKSIIGFSGRLMDKNEKEAKYVNTPETALYKKRDTLYGIQLAKDAILKQDSAIIVEGEFDMISSFHHGIPNTVAVKGSAVTKGQLELLKRYTKRIILALDADFSGSETTKKAIQDAEELDFRIDVVNIPDGKDPDESLKHNPAIYKKALQKPIPIYDFIIQSAQQKHDIKSPYGKKEIMNLVNPFISKIANPIVKSHYIKAVSQLLEVKEEDINATIDFLKKKDKLSTVRNADDTSNDPKVNKNEEIQKIFLASILQSDKPIETYQTVADILDATYFTVPSYVTIFERLASFTATNFDINVFADSLPEQLQKVVDDLFMYDMSGQKITDSEFERNVLEYKRQTIKQKLSALLKADPQSTLLQDLAQELARVEKQRSTV